MFILIKDNNLSFMPTIIYINIMIDLFYTALQNPLKREIYVSKKKAS